MEEEGSISEDEWVSIKRRFKSEGIDWEGVEPLQKVLQVFRWLVDAEANLKASRKISAKLRKQHEDEKKEWMKYSDHLRGKYEDRIKEFEEERNSLKEDLEALLSGTQGMANIFEQEGLDDLAHSPLGDQIAYLLVERTQLLEDLKESSGKNSEFGNNIASQLVKVESERNLLKQKNERLKNKMKEMAEKTTSLERALSKLSLGAIDDKLRLFSVADETDEGVPLGMKGVSISEPSSINYPLTPIPAADKETLLRRTRLQDRRASEMLPQRQNSIDSMSGGESPQRLTSLFESQILNSKTHLTHLTDVKKLKDEIERLTTRYLEEGNKYETILRKYEILKLTSVNEKELLKQEFEWKENKWKNEITRAKSNLKSKEETCKEDDALRKRIEEDLKDLLSKRQDEQTRKEKIEEQLNEIEKEKSTLEEKLKHLENENKKLSSEVREILISKVPA